jgi:hypothetical protein
MLRIALFVLLLVIQGTASAVEPVPSPDAFEREVIQCMKNDERGKNCLRRLLSIHARVTSPKYEEQVTAAVEFFYQWLADDRVFAVHKVVEENRGDLLSARAYLIEDDQGNYILFESTLMKMRSNWYLNRFYFSNQEEEMESALGIKI